MYQSIFSFFKKPVVRIIVSLLILILILFWLPFAELKRALQNISLYSWILVLFGFICGHLIGVVKWRILINMGESTLPFHTSVQCYFAGLFSNLFLPSLAGGDIVKTGLAIHHNQNKGATIFGTLLDRLIDTASVVFIIIVAALYSPQFLQSKDQYVIYTIVALFAVIFLMGIIFILMPVEKIRIEKVKNLLLHTRRIIHRTFKHPVKPAIAFMLSLGIQSAFIFLTVYLAKICGIDIPVLLWFLVWPLAKLSALLPISLGGIGVREVALVALLNRLSVPAANSVAVGLLWESVLIVGGLLGGVLYWTMKNFKTQKEPSLTAISKENIQIQDLPKYD